jgi:beta-galactosidase
MPKTNARLRRLLAAVGAAALFAAGAADARAVSSFDDGWLFHKGDMAGPDGAGFDDSAWPKVDLPDDWEIAGPFDEHAASTGSGAWLPTGVAWYRKHFAAPQARHVFVEFDGVMERSGVWINGQHLDFHPSGYTSFRYELTRFLKPGDNVIAVRADTSHQPASRWYAGGGIYRHVRLIEKGDVHVDTWGSYVTTPRVDAGTAEVKLQSTVVNQGADARRAHLEADLIDPAGAVAATVKGAAAEIASGASAVLEADGIVNHPQLWDVEHPNLYRARIRVVADDGRALDEDAVTFGVRDAHFEAATGFWLNGRNIKLKGAAIHADGGAFGMAVPLPVYERRLRILKSLGVNAIRTAHHDFSPEFLDLCDRLGLVVMDEAFDMWTVAKNPEDYHLYFADYSSGDARAQADRDRNHPSVVVWSIGNEIHDTPYAEPAKANLVRLRDVFHAEDPSRPVTMALFRPNTSHDYDDGLADLLDVVGQNYRETELAKAHADKPSRRIIGTENSKERASWLVVRDNPAYAGMFLWTGIDYLGEAERAGWPYIENPSGLIDRDGVVKPIGWERAAWWSDRPVVRIARRTAVVKDTAELVNNEIKAAQRRLDPGAYADWTPKDLSPHAEKVEVYSNAAGVELFLNGRSLGKQAKNPDDSARTWDVTFAPGELKAVGYDEAGKTIAQDALRTAGTPAAVRLTAENATLHGASDIGFVRAEVVDAKGTVVPTSGVAISVAVRGAGKLAAFDNGSPVDHTAFSSPTRDSYLGNALVFVAPQGNGKISVDVSSPGLKGGHADLIAF